MPFLSREETIARLKERRAAEGPDAARADFNLALIILGSALFENRLWSGRDYGEHPVAVAMRNTHSNTKMIIGLLHDVVEDSDWTVDDLREAGFSPRVVAGVDAMTRRAGEMYFDFVQRCSRNPDAIDKKIEDLSHNMDFSRVEKLPAAKDMERLQKYVLARAYLVAVKKGQAQAGSSLAAFVQGRPDLDGPVAQGLLAQHAAPAAASIKRHFQP